METNNWKRTPGIGMLRRTLFLMATCGIAAFAVLLARLDQLQITEHEKYESLAVAQQLREAASSSERGMICDRNGVPLAISATVDNVYLSPDEIEMYGEERTHHYYYTIPVTAAHTMAALMEMGVPAEAFAIPEGK
jgi:cell division protein FtsI/penicillin-binding protein 2